MDDSMNDATVLFVEDDEDSYLLMKRALEKNGVSSPVYWTRDGEDAVAYLSGQGPYADRSQYPLPSLILLDIGLPRKSGLEVLEWIKKHPFLRSIPTVMLTGSSHSKDIDRALELRANSYCVKPWESGELMRLSRLVRRYLRKVCLSR